MLGFFHQQNHHHLVRLIWGLVPELRLSVFNQDFLQDQLLHDRFLIYQGLITKVKKGILHLDFLLVLCSLFFRQFHPPNFSLGNPKKKTIQPNGKRETSWHPLSACLRTRSVGRRGIWGIWVGSSRATPPMELPALLPARPAPWRARRRKAGACRRGELKDVIKVIPLITPFERLGREWKGWDFECFFVSFLHVWWECDNYSFDLICIGSVSWEGDGNKARLDTYGFIARPAAASPTRTSNRIDVGEVTRTWIFWWMKTDQIRSRDLKKRLKVWWRWNDVICSMRNDK